MPLRKLWSFSTLILRHVSTWSQRCREHSWSGRGQGGQGYFTAFAQLAATVFHLPFATQGHFTRRGDILTDSLATTTLGRICDLFVTKQEAAVMLL